MRKRSASCLILIASALPGCAVGPDYQPPALQLPAEWSADAQNGMTAQMPERLKWWTLFKDPILDSLVNRAAAANLDLRSAAARLLEARSARRYAAADLWPSANTSVSYAHQRLSKNQPVFGQLKIAGEIPLESNVYETGFDAAWELDLFGGRRRALEAADADLAAGEAALDDTLVSLLAEVAQNYIELRALQTRIVIVNENIKVQQDAADLTRARFKGGLTSELDFSQAAGLLAATQAALPALESSLARSMHQLALLLAREPDALLEELSSQSLIPLVPPEIPVGLPSDLLRRRPDVRLAERKLAAATARVGVATAEFFPKFSLTGGIGLESISLSEFLNSESRFYNAGPSIRWRLFDAGRLQANLEAFNARQAEALAAYQKTVLVSLRDVEDALAGYGKEKQRLRSLQAEYEQYRRSVEIARALYSHGQVTFLNVLDAQRALLQAQNDRAQSEAALCRNLIALYKALGGGWDAFSRPFVPAETVSSSSSEVTDSSSRQDGQPN